MGALGNMYEKEIREAIKDNLKYYSSQVEEYKQKLIGCKEYNLFAIHKLDQEKKEYIKKLVDEKNYDEKSANEDADWFFSDSYEDLEKDEREYFGNLRYFMIMNKIYEFADKYVQMIPEDEEF